MTSAYTRHGRCQLWVCDLKSIVIRTLSELIVLQKRGHDTLKILYCKIASPKSAVAFVHEGQSLRRVALFERWHTQRAALECECDRLIAVNLDIPQALRQQQFPQRSSVFN